jgi:hypothetical protein
MRSSEPFKLMEGSLKPFIGAKYGQKPYLAEHILRLQLEHLLACPIWLFNPSVQAFQ